MPRPSAKKLARENERHMARRLASLKPLPQPPQQDTPPQRPPRAEPPA